jgi:gamma-carbonic anhydrase
MPRFSAGGFHRGVKPLPHHETGARAEFLPRVSHQSLRRCPTAARTSGMTVEERLARHLGRTPDVARAAFVAPNATVLGDVTLGQLSSVWYGCVLRGDINSIVIGEGTNVQDGTVVHLADDYPVRVGRYTTIGHAAILHACEIGDECLVGMGATVLDGARIGDRCIVGANALVTQRFIAPAGSLILGAPARIVRALSEDEQRGLRRWAEKYLPVARAHAERKTRKTRKTRET